MSTLQTTVYVVAPLLNTPFVDHSKSIPARHKSSLPIDRLFRDQAVEFEKDVNTWTRVRSSRRLGKRENFAVGAVLQTKGESMGSSLIGRSAWNCHSFRSLAFFGAPVTVCSLFIINVALLVMICLARAFYTVYCRVYCIPNCNDHAASQLARNHLLAMVALGHCVNNTGISLDSANTNGVCICLNALSWVRRPDKSLVQSPNALMDQRTCTHLWLANTFGRAIKANIWRLDCMLS